jgi:hypothetical protein
VPLDPTRVSVSFVPADGSAPLRVLTGGEPEQVDEARASQILAQEDFGLDVELGLGGESARFWTCDFSYVSVCVECVSYSPDSHLGIRPDQRRLPQLDWCHLFLTTMHYGQASRSLSEVDDLAHCSR